MDSVYGSIPAFTKISLNDLIIVSGISASSVYYYINGLTKRGVIEQLPRAHQKETLYVQRSTPDPSIQKRDDMVHQLLYGKIV